MDSVFNKFFAKLPSPSAVWTSSTEIVSHIQFLQIIPPNEQVHRDDGDENSILGSNDQLEGISSVSSSVAKNLEAALEGTSRSWKVRRRSRSPVSTVGRGPWSTVERLRESKPPVYVPLPGLAL